MIFNWDNFEDYIPNLLPDGIEAEWVFESDAGQIVNYRLMKKYGSGRFEYMRLKDDIRVMVVDCHWPNQATFCVQDNQWIRFNFSLSIDIKMQSEQKTLVETSLPSWRVINNGDNAKMIETIPADAHSRWVTICCKPQVIEMLTGKSQADLPDLFRTTLDVNTVECFYRYFNFSSRLHALTSDMLDNSFCGSLRLSFIEACSKQMLCLALNELLLGKSEKQNIVKISEYDKACIAQAKRLLKENISSPPSVESLSRLVGINRNKLYYGFKQLYATTISEYIHLQQLELGKHLLTTTERSIQEVAQSVGFNHQCNFTTAIKRHFGYTPMQLRANARASAES